MGKFNSQSDRGTMTRAPLVHYTDSTFCAIEFL